VSPEAFPPGRRRLVLMRHGEVRYVDGTGRPVDPRTVQLTATGVAQAEAAGRLLADTPLERVWCSPLPRSRRTAELVTDRRGLAIEIVEDFIEVRLGRLAELTPERFDAEFVYGFDRAAEPGASFAGGERFVDFMARVTGRLEALLHEPGWEVGLVVSHEGVNRALLAWAVGGGPAAMGRFDQDMGCLNIVDVDLAEGAIQRTIIRAVNVTPADPAKALRRLTSMERVARDLRRG
jgi:broad specificity phosphatase PhoE